MLPLRLAIFAAVFGIALSGLFWLLGNLSEPELLRSKKAVVVKGCDPIETEDAARICPQLFCQKFLLDSRVFELRYRFDVTVDKKSGAEQLIGGVAKPFVAKPGDGPVRSFVCVLERNKVIEGRALDAVELDELAEQDTWLAASSDEE
ncbi:MAG TPA: hypothetical protein VGD45_15620 [Steroidobacter sp.]|uniref:hypothetical protein n=1 Tax=Steroidobacter sp. TaxID=1978227 RepID=UPI002EDA7552